MSRSRTDSRSFALLLGIIWVAFALRALPITTQSFWRDETDALCYAFQFPHLLAQAVHPDHPPALETPCACPALPVPPPPDGADLLHRLLPTLRAMIRQNGPLYFFLLRGWIWMAGWSMYALRFFSLVFGVLMIPLAYVIGRRWFDRTTGIVTALLVATSPYLIWYSQEVKMYTLVPVLALLAIYGLQRALDGRPLWWAVQILSTTLAFYSHILAALLIPVQFLAALTCWPLTHRRWRGALFSLVCLTVPYLPMLVWQARQVVQTRQTGFYPYTLGEMIQVLLNGWSAGVIGSGWILTAGLMTFLVVLGSYYRLALPPLSGAISMARRGLIICVWWLTVPLLVLWAISLRQPLFTDRYLIWTAPAFYLLVAGGVASLSRQRLWREWARRGAALLLLGLLLSNGIHTWRQGVTPIKSDFRAVAYYVAERYRPDELIVFQIPHGRYTFDYYFRIEMGTEPGQARYNYLWVDGIYTNHRGPDGGYLMNEDSVARQMATMTADYNVVWLIATETGMWDQRGLVKKWLDVNSRETQAQHFNRVDVYRYTLAVGSPDEG